MEGFHDLYFPFFKMRNKKARFWVGRRSSVQGLWLMLLRNDRNASFFIDALEAIIMPTLNFQRF